MTADVIPLPTARPVEIRASDKVEHKESGAQGFAFKIEGGRLTVLRLGEMYVGDIGEWRPV